MTFDWLLLFNCFQCSDNHSTVYSSMGGLMCLLQQGKPLEAPLLCCILPPTHQSSVIKVLHYGHLCGNCLPNICQTFFYVDCLWPPCGIGQAIIFLLCGFFLSFSSPNPSGHRLDVYHTSTHGVALVRI